MLLKLLSRSVAILMSGSSRYIFIYIYIYIYLPLEIYEMQNIQSKHKSIVTISLYFHLQSTFFASIFFVISGIYIVHLIIPPFEIHFFHRRISLQTAEGVQEAPPRYFFPFSCNFPQLFFRSLHFSAQNLRFFSILHNIYPCDI